MHRDLKPQNLMLDERSKLYIVDFGISKRVDAPEEPGKKHNFVGTDVIMQARPATPARTPTSASGSGPSTTSSRCSTSSSTS